MCYSSSPDIQLLRLAFLAAIYFPLPNIVLTRLLPSIFEVKGPGWKPCIQTSAVLAELQGLYPVLLTTQQSRGTIPSLPAPSPDEAALLLF